MKETAEFKRLPLRDRKYARTRVGLLNAALAALEERSLDEVTVTGLCDAVGISEAGFFNYFPRKADLLVYYVQLWALEMAWHASRRTEGEGALAAIEEVFERTARRIAEHPRVMLEVIAGQIRMVGRPATAEVTEAERLLALPGLGGIEEVQAIGVAALFPPLLSRAIEAGELPPDTDLAAVLAALRAVFFGVPVAQRSDPAGTVGNQYRRQLAWLWAGVRALT